MGATTTAVDSRYYAMVPRDDGKLLADWASYVDDLKATGHVADAALYELPSGRQLASSRPQFTLTDSEFRELAGDVLRSSCPRRGICINGCSYRVHASDGRFGLMGKSGFPVAGCSVCRTRTLLIVAVHRAGMKPAVCNEAVMNMGDFFVRRDL